MTGPTGGGPTPLPGLTPSTGRLTTVSGYTLQSSMAGVDTWQVNTTGANFAASNCLSTLDQPATDIEAWNNGFVAVSPLDSDRSAAGWRVQQYRFLERLF